MPSEEKLTEADIARLETLADVALRYNERHGQFPGDTTREALELAVCALAEVRRARQAALSEEERETLQDARAMVASTGPIWTERARYDRVLAVLDRLTSGGGK